MQERHIDQSPPAHALTGDQTTTQACAQARNRPSNLISGGTMPNQLSHTGWAVTLLLNLWHRADHMAFLRKKSQQWWQSSTLPKQMLPSQIVFKPVDMYKTFSV